mgnify:CR=1 FL=1
MTSTTTRPKSNSSNLLEEALNQPPIGETANFAWNATPLGIAAIYKGLYMGDHSVVSLQHRFLGAVLRYRGTPPHAQTRPAHR